LIPDGFSSKLSSILALAVQQANERYRDRVDEYPRLNNALLTVVVSWRVFLRAFAKTVTAYGVRVQQFVMQQFQ
jgi:hypothetical protein